LPKEDDNILIPLTQRLFVTSRWARRHACERKMQQTLITIQWWRSHIERLHWETQGDTKKKKNIEEGNIPNYGSYIKSNWMGFVAIIEGDTLVMHVCTKNA
jgi:hypothetical protein